MYICGIPRRVFSIDDDGKLYRLLYLCGLKFRVRRRVSLSDSAPFWKKFVKLPIQEDKILFRSVSAGYGDSPKYIAEEILRQKLPYKLVWVLDIDGLYALDSFPPEVKVVIAGTEDAYYEYYTSRIQIDSNLHLSIDGGYGKRVGQTLIQLWHGSLGFKKFYWHSPFHWSASALDAIKRNIPQIDYIVSTSLRMNTLLRRVFLNKGKILEYGFPRNDILVRGVISDIREKVLRRICVPSDRKVLLYAPTWRSNAAGSKMYNIDYERVIQALRHRFGGDWYIAARMHHEMLRASDSFKHTNSRIIDVSRYVDTNELLVAADALITDYSSIVVDYLLTDKPCFAYVPDRDNYEKEVQLYLRLEDFPFSIAETNDALVNNILSFDDAAYIANNHSFLQDKGFWEKGQASERIVELIKQISPPHHKLY